MSDEHLAPAPQSSVATPIIVCVSPLLDRRIGLTLVAIGALAIIACLTVMASAIQITTEDLRRLEENLQRQNAETLGRMNALNGWAVGIGTGVVGGLLTAIKILWSSLRRAQQQTNEAHAGMLTLVERSNEDVRKLLRENMEASGKNRAIVQRLVERVSGGKISVEDLMERSSG